ncbi:Glycosyltransferase involved in cell wall bisynthesis [Rugamonas rubra]|uniref:Glycosyltransferase involved in cell wall bisynthesis n=1 Tax=Rugamonas rubra TaxID=758825 RepID=A0A1I4NNI3_9BURK|nr:Glycosyltransferase involved in cell wall bisynthesis [Rugamonas rubra]
MNSCPDCSPGARQKTNHEQANTVSKPHIWIVSPASAKANNGNWQSAKRWARFLRTRYRVTIAQQWPASDGDAGDTAPDLLIALHARRSAAALAAFHQAWPQRPTVLLLTGTDLYRDIQHDASAQAALRQASALVVLQPDGLTHLPAPLRSKASVIYQSAATLRAATAQATHAQPAGGAADVTAPAAPPAPRRRHLDICMIGHLRAEKDPQTFMRAAALVTAPAARLLHIGGALEPELGRLAQQTQAATPRYHWLGALPHGATRQRLKRSFLMALTSHMEGGANVIIEAVTCGVAVLASDIGGNRGMLGDDYEGYFAPGDAAALAGLIERCIAEPAFHARLRAQCAARAPLFAPAAERAALLKLVDNLLHSPHHTTLQRKPI